MSIFSGRNPDATWGKCERCKKPMIIRKEGQKYGRRCARILAGQVELDSNALVSSVVLRKRSAAGISAEESAVEAHLGAGLA